MNRVGLNPLVSTKRPFLCQLDSDFPTWPYVPPVPSRKVPSLTVYFCTVRFFVVWRHSSGTGQESRGSTNDSCLTLCSLPKEKKNSLSE